MLSPTAALQEFTKLFGPLDVQHVQIDKAVGRVLARPVTAPRDQRPFAASAMDGYAMQAADASPGNHLEIVGESSAGHSHHGTIISGTAVRIFTGAPMPKGADKVVMQEQVSARKSSITLHQKISQKSFIKPTGGDFLAGETMTAPRKIQPHDIMQLASMGLCTVPVYRKPAVALLSTGDELVMPGGVPRAQQIFASNIYGLAALLREQGADARILPIGADNVASLTSAFSLCATADLIVTIGGSAAGDYDIVRNVTKTLGFITCFDRVDMRPGGSTMAGKLQNTPLIGLPGNPLPSMVCGQYFLRPAVQKMQGLGGQPLNSELARLGVDLDENRGSEHFILAHAAVEYSQLTIYPAARYPKSVLAPDARPNALLVRPPNDPPKKIGDMVAVIRL